MATLDAFGFSKGRKNKAISVNEQQVTTCAFINPSLQPIKKPALTTTITKKKMTTNKIKSNKTITHYFTPIVDVEMKEVHNDEEEVIICTIRNKRSVFDDLWNIIQSEFTEEYYFEEEEEEINSTSLVMASKRRRNELEQENNTNKNQLVVLNTMKKKKKRADADLSNFMTRFLNIQDKRKQTNQSQILKCIEQEQKDDDDEEEDLSRMLRHKMTVQESQSFFFQITSEFLYE